MAFLRFDPQVPTPPLDILAVAPHPDDAEISCGGLLAVSKRQGLRVGVLDLTDGEPTPRGTPERRSQEAAVASERLGLDWRAWLGLPNRCLEHTLESRRQLAEVFRVTQPRLILCPYWDDAHPDHVAACQLIEAARFWSKLTRSDLAGDPFHPPRILYYFSIHLRIHPQPTIVFDISDVIDAKLDSVAAYGSQFPPREPTAGPGPLDDLRDRARYWGWAIFRPYGEPYVSREAWPVESVAALVRPPASHTGAS